MVFKMKTIVHRIKDFLIDYGQRHSHPINAFWHILGVPIAFIGLYKFLTGSFAIGFTLLLLGYLFQYLGHKAQGNEVGEVTLIKKCYTLLKKNRDKQINNTANINNQLTK
jgi:hypothetical protein